MTASCQSNVSDEIFGKVLSQRDDRKVVAAPEFLCKTNQLRGQTLLRKAKILLPDSLIFCTTVSYNF